MFASAVYLGDRTWNLREVPDILVTLSGELNIIVPANKASPAIYIDVPLDSVLEVSFHRRSVLDLPKPTYGLILQLDTEARTSCTLNAIGYTEKHMEIAFSIEKDAKTLKRLLVPTDLQKNSGQSPSDDELAAPGPALSDSQKLRRTASLARALIPRRDAVSTIDPSMLERVHTSFPRASTEGQEDSSNPAVQFDEDPRSVGHFLEMAEEGIDVSQYNHFVEQASEGIDVSQLDGSSHEKPQDQGDQASIPKYALAKPRVHHFQAPGDTKQNPTRQSDRTSGIRPSSPLRNAPKSHPQPAQQDVSMVSKAQNRRSPAFQNGDHDDLYDASPKAKKSQRRSPRISARGNTPQTLDRLLQSTVQQAYAKTNSSTKLSRQLRNADGVVESRIEHTADSDLAASMEKGAGFSKDGTNSKKSKIPRPAKVQATTKKATIPDKKNAQSREKAAAKEGPPDAPGNYDLLPSPKRDESTIQTSANDKVTGTRPKTTKARRDKPRNTKPMPMKASTTVSSKEPPQESTKRFGEKAKANGSVKNSDSKRLSGKEAYGDEDIWDVDHAYSENQPQPRRQAGQPTTTLKKYDARVPKIVKLQVDIYKSKHNKPVRAQKQHATKRNSKVKPAPAALSQSRPQRSAAIKANKRIQGLDESDEIIIDDETVPVRGSSKGHMTLAGAKTPKSHKVKDGGNDRRKFGGKLSIAISSTKHFVPDSISPDFSEKQRPGSVAKNKTDSGPEKVDLVGNAPAEVRRSAASEKGNNLRQKNLISVSGTSATPLPPGNGRSSNQLDPPSMGRHVRSSKAAVAMVPDSVPKVHEAVTETEPASINFQKDDDVKPGKNDPDVTKSAHSGNKEHVEYVPPRIDDASLKVSLRPAKGAEGVSFPEAPTASMTVDVRQKRTSPRLAETVQKSVPKTLVTIHDPFVAKLNASLPQPEDISAKVKDIEVSEKGTGASNDANVSKQCELEASSRNPQTTAFITPRVMPSDEAKHAENHRRRLESGMQVDGEDERSFMQSLKFADKPVSASRVKGKRQIEQIGDASNKKVKLAGISARKTFAHDAEKTPAPIVSKKPLVIGFSPSGPRNQGISTEKPKPPQHVGKSTCDTGQLDKHQISMFTERLSEGGINFVQEALGKVPEDVDGTQAGAHASPAPEQAQKFVNVKALVTRHAIAQDFQAEKRKLATFVDEPTPWEHEPFIKRQKKDVKTPPAVRKHHPIMIPDISPVLIHDRSQRLSSQNTRVNENGSPMPFMITYNENTVLEEQYSEDDDGKDALAEARREEQCVFQDDDPVLPEPGLPVPSAGSAVSIPNTKMPAHQSFSNNSKQVPSSPHASSAFGTMPPHHLYQDGEIVNAETKESIVPIEPQDPFHGASQNPQNAFMTALRKSTEFQRKGLVSGDSRNKDSGTLAKDRSLHVGEDPDKTLVESDLRKSDKKPRALIISSGSLSNTSTHRSQLSEPSKEENDAEIEAQWRKGIEPHQGNMLDCLLNVSHVSNNSIVFVAED